MAYSVAFSLSIPLVYKYLATYLNPFQAARPCLSVHPQPLLVTTGEVPRSIHRGIVFVFRVLCDVSGRDIAFRKGIDAPASSTAGRNTHVWEN